MNCHHHFIGNICTKCGVGHHIAQEDDLAQWKQRAGKAEAACATLNDEIGNLRERATHAEQAALEMAEKIDELKAQTQLMREALESIETHYYQYCRKIAKEALAKLNTKGQ